MNQDATSAEAVFACKRVSYVPDVSGEESFEGAPRNVVRNFKFSTA
jgi:hypothetical protein